VEKVADPGFTQGVLMSQVLGTLALRMSEAELLPFRFSHYAAKLDEAVTLADGWAREAAVPMDAASLRTRAAAVQQAAVALETAIDARLARGTPTAAEAAAVNDLLARMEQRLADDDGAPDTKWYRHVFYGWNIYSLYDGQPFPGLAEACRVKDVARVTHEVQRIERALDRLQGGLTEARTALAGGH
jgi:N-acetylated-alpha-linked acidic dipeptidase